MAEMIAWAAPQIEILHGRSFSNATTAMGVENEDGKLLAVVCFHEWDPESGTIQASAAAADARWLMARGVINQIWRYAFETCDCQKVWAICARSNERMLRCFNALGFTFEAVLTRQFGNDDGVIARRFREEFYGQEKRPAQAA